MKHIKVITTFVFGILILFTVNNCNTAHKAIPSGVLFQKETIKRLGSVGDNWCITWAKDGSQVTSMCDGNWLNIDNPHGGFHNHLFRIKGGKFKLISENLKFMQPF